MGAARVRLILAPPDLDCRKLRALGVTVRKTIDTIIATRCIVSDYALLHSDRDFEPFALHLGLRCVACDA